MDRIIKLVETLTRPGTAEVVKYLKKGSFATREGGSTHHKYAGGLVAHSLEVYEGEVGRTGFLRRVDHHLLFVP